MMPRHEITARDAHHPCAFPVMGTWVLSVLQMHLYIYSFAVKLFATVSPHSSLKLTPHQPSAPGKAQGAGRMDREAKEIKNLAQGCSGVSVKVLLSSPGLCLLPLVREGALWLSCCSQSLSPVVQRGEFSALQQESELLSWCSFLVCCHCRLGPCSSSISWLPRALTAAFLLSVMSTGSTAQLH